MVLSHEYCDLLRVGAEEGSVLMDPLQRHNLVVDPVHQAVATLQRLRAPEPSDPKPVCGPQRTPQRRRRQEQEEGAAHS